MIRPVVRLWYRIVAWFCWRNIDSLQTQRRHTVRRIVQIETGVIQVPYRTHELKVENAHLRGLDYSIRATQRTATRAAMAAQI